MRRPDNPRDSGTIDPDDRPFDFDADDVEGRCEPVGAARHVVRGGPEEADVDGETTDGEYGPGSD